MTASALRKAASEDSAPFAPPSVTYDDWKEWLLQTLTANPALLEDRHWCLNNLYWIQDEDGRQVLYRMRDVQQRLYRDQSYWNVVLKSRQHGVSTAILLSFLDGCFWSRDAAAGVIAHNREAVQKLFRSKVRYPYEHLPDWLRARNPAKQDSAHELVFANGSSISVGTSLRSGTYQMVLITGYGKICAQTPDKATEIRSGVLNTVHPGNVLWIESTAEGRSGHFFDICRDARAMAESGLPPSKLGFQFFFFGWHQDPKNAIDPRKVVVRDELQTYFGELRDMEGIKLTPGQKAWYAERERMLGELMFREHPSTPDEAFRAAIEGSYFGKDILRARREGRVMPSIPLVPTIPVHTTWDLGKNDETAIWFCQIVRREIRWLSYYENTSEGLSYYWRYLKEFAEQHSCFFGKHYLPHDVTVSDLSADRGVTRLSLLEEMGMRDAVVVPRVASVIDGIEAVRRVLPLSYFSESGCSTGLLRLEQYQRELDERTESFKDTPRHDQASNGADAFRQFCQMFDPATSYPQATRARRSRRRTGSPMAR